MTANFSWGTLSGLPTTGAGVADAHATAPSIIKARASFISLRRRQSRGFVTGGGTKDSPHSCSTEMGDRNAEPIIAGGGAAETGTRGAGAYQSSVGRALVSRGDAIKRR